MKRRTAWVLVAAVAAMALGAAVIGAIALALRGPQAGPWSARSSAGSYLYLDLDEEIPEQPPVELASFLERRPPSLRALVSSIDRAAADAQVRALVLRVTVLPDSGWGKVQELRDAIGRFRASGKPAYAHLEFAGNKEYYLATACSKIYAVPSAILDVSGLRSETVFFRGTLDKLGVEAQFEGVGKYKNAPNQLTESGFTEPHREQMDALLDSVYSQYLAALATGRGKSLAEAQAAVDGGPYDADRALAMGLVDELLYTDQLAARLQHGERVSPARYLRGASRRFALGRRPRIALVYAVGEIVTGESQSGAFGGEVAGSDTVAAALRSAREDASIAAIVLRVDSPGGSGTASDVIWREVRLAREKKPVVASMGDMAASGGYYIAMGSDAIVAQPGTITGSIGVFGGKFTLRGLYDKLGIAKEILVRGENADLFTDYRPWDESERATFRALMESFYDDFIRRAAEGRRKTPEEIHAVAQGRVWTGAEAVRVGLVDRLGGIDVALAEAKQRAKIAATQDVDLVVLPERKGLLETILERQDDGIEETALPRDVRAMLRWARHLGDGRVAARLPFELRIR